MRNFRAYHTFSREKGNCVTLRDAIGRLHDILRDLEDPDEIAFMGAKFIGETLGVSRAGYGTINKAEETITIERDWNAPGIKSLAGTLRFRDYGSYIEDLKVGRTVVFADAETDPRTRDRAPALKAISAQSAVNMPLTEQGGVVALLYLNHQTARPWSEEELGFIREAAERIRTTVQRRRAEQELREEAQALQVLNRTGAAIASNLDLAEVVQIVTDAGVELTRAAFGAFFYNVINDAGESYTLYTLSGAPREAFSKFPMPRNTAIFAPTFTGEGTVRSDDILEDPRYGRNAPYKGMPEGHLPVRSYLAVPVQSRSGQVIGGLFFGHQQPGIFNARAERLMTGLAGQASIAIDNARLFEAAQKEIAQRKAAEEKLRELNTTLELRSAEEAERRGKAEERFRLLVQSVTDYAIYMLDTNGHVSSWNPGAERFKGYSADEIMGQHFSRFYTEEDKAADIPRIALETAQSVGRFEAEGWRVRKDGSRFWASVIIDPIRTEDGRLIGFAKVTRDLTEKRETEERLRQSQKMEAVGQLTGGLAHDFNNLLAGISGSIEMMQTRLAQGRAQEVDRYLLAAQGAVKRAAALTHRLLAFSRRQTLDPQPTNPNRLLLELEELVRRTMGPSIEVEVVGTSGAWPILVDPNQLENAILNLCINARDAMPNGGKLTIETANRWMDTRAARQQDLPEGQYVSICVTDTGTGMPPDVKAKAFDPFFTTKPLGEGTGLGLSMVYGFARQSGGQVRIYSELGEGTTMCIYLPRHNADVAAEENNAIEDRPLSDGQGEVVLVIDDEPTIRMLIGELLAEAGYAVIEAPDGPAGLKVLESNARIDLLITDVGLPGGMNGRQIADAARVNRPDLKVLFITGYAENAVVSKGRLEKGMYVATKPFKMDELAARIREIVRE
jgi:PAS domain S-box-containing protein